MTVEKLRIMLAERGYVRGAFIGTYEEWQRHDREAVYLPRYECPESSQRWAEHSSRLLEIEERTR